MALSSFPRAGAGVFRCPKISNTMDRVNSITQRVYYTPREQKRHLPISSYEVVLFKDAAALLLQPQKLRSQSRENLLRKKKRRRVRVLLILSPNLVIKVSAFLFLSHRQIWAFRFTVIFMLLPLDFSNQGVDRLQYQILDSRSWKAHVFESEFSVGLCLLCICVPQPLSKDLQIQIQAQGLDQKQIGFCVSLYR